MEPEREREMEPDRELELEPEREPERERELEPERERELELEPELERELLMYSTMRAEKYRKHHPMGLNHKPGDDYGWFELKLKGVTIRCQSNSSMDGYDFEHVSVSSPWRCPTWDEMCFVKDLFWDEDDCVVQYHPKKSEYVNMAKHCLHLWRWAKGEFPVPMKIEVGL